MPSLPCLEKKKGVKIVIKLTIYDLIGYIFKHKLFVFIFVAIASILGFFVINNTQTYTAQAVIRFTGLNTEDGYTTQGTKLDVYEIISPRVISEAIQTLGVDENVEDVRSSCTIVGIIPNDVQELKEANQKEGVEFTYYPKDYTVSYTAESDKSSEYARDMVDAILSAYTKYYSNTYLSTYSLPEIKFDTVEVQYDYLEMVEIINTAIEDCAAYFDTSALTDEEFRSPRTGYTFSNMSGFYGEIKNVTLPTIFSQIIDGHITKNKEVFLKTYQYKKEKARLEYDTKHRNSETAMNLMKEFVNANKNVPSGYGKDEDDDKYHAYDVYDLHEEKNNVSSTTYDQLINNYVVDGVSAEEFLIDEDYYNKIYEIFNSPVSENIDQNELTKKIEEEIADTIDKVSELYDITNIFMDDFKRYQLTKNINLLTSITTKGNNPENLFKGIVFVMSVLTACVSVITYEVVLLVKKNKKSKETEEKS